MSEKYIPAKVKRKVQLAAKGLCEYCFCLESNSISPFHFDHIVPTSLGGISVYENLARSCGGCNNAKSNYIVGLDPLTRQSVPLYRPREDEWSTHFRWSDDYLTIIGITATGRATIEVLRLNRKGVVNMRKLTVTTGEHPPFY